MIEANAAHQSSQGSAQSSQGRVERRMRCSRGAKGGRIRSAATWRVHCGSPSAWSLRSSSACSTSSSEESARSTEAQAPRQSGASLENEKRSGQSPPHRAVPRSCIPGLWLEKCLPVC